MPRLKKTRTGSTSGHLRKLRQIRREVAAEAARIIATESQHNYHAAKKKAADRIGVSERLALPSNIEVQEALTAYQGLYGGAAHRENLEHLRRTAVEAMQWLEGFNPRLVGPVLDGTAGNHSRISLHVFADSVEAVVLFFLERGTTYRQEQRQIRWFNGEHRLVPLIVLGLAGVDIELAVFEPVHLRQAPPSPIDGRPQRRAAVGEVEYLLQQQSA